MTWAYGLVGVALFSLTARLLGITKQSRQAITVSKMAVQTVRNQLLSDDEKEKMMRENAITLVKLFLQISFGLAAALFIMFMFLWFIDHLTLARFDSLLSDLLSPKMILAGTLVWATVTFAGLRSKSATRDAVNDSRP